MAVDGMAAALLVLLVAGAYQHAFEVAGANGMQECSFCVLVEQLYWQSEHLATCSRASSYDSKPMHVGLHS